ncbi:MAG TPA: plasmid pRiA4b ORF-3 family protein [Steroidobacteraceae bacterium]|jgi:hypothetical protein|nr:plasmid pRiA4b ORF-3 family protein [Steroidobacteraceae bacterium]
MGNPASYILRVELLDIEPLIWRRLRVPRSIAFPRLHEILQLALGWQDSHLYEFRAEELVIGMKDIDDADEREGVQDENEWRLRELLDTGVTEFECLYDFGDGWRHRIVVEPATRGGKSGPSPLCLAGENACPPENVGGPHRYVTFLRAIANPAGREHRELVRWIGGIWDPKGFDLNRVNRDLRALLGTKRRRR